MNLRNIVDRVCLSFFFIRLVKPYIRRFDRGCEFIQSTVAGGRSPAHISRDDQDRSHVGAVRRSLRSEIMGKKYIKYSSA